MTGEVRTRWSLDREEQEEYQVEVVAEDQGHDVRLSGSCLLTVKVRDENDHQPVLTNNLETVRLRVSSSATFRGSSAPSTKYWGGRRSWLTSPRTLPSEPRWSQWRRQIRTQERTLRLVWSWLKIPATSSRSTL